MISKPYHLNAESYAFERILVLSSAFLLAIWPLPGTIGLRHLLLLAGFLSAIQVVRHSETHLCFKRAWPIWFLVGFFIWLAVHLIFLSSNYSEQVKELTGLWVRALMAAVMGLGLGLTLIKSKAENQCIYKVSELSYTNIIIAGFGGTVTIFFVRYLFEVYQTHYWLYLDFYMTPYAGKPPVVIFGVTFFALILLQFREAVFKSLTWKSFAALIVGSFLVFFAEYFANTKNGIALLFLPLSIFIFTLIFYYSWSIRKIMIAIAIIIPLFFSVGFVLKKHIEVNAAWPMLLADLRVAKNIDSSSAWKDPAKYPYPYNERGVAVNVSTYERASWAVAAVRLIQENPLGYGLVHHSFGALAIKKWPDFHKPIGSFRGASHSGWLDFTLGLGVPGLFLILVPFAAAFYRSFSCPFFWSQFVRWIFPIILIAYLITEVSNNHFIEFLFFIISFCIGITLVPKDRLMSSK